jgi:hypothetical protein
VKCTALIPITFLMGTQTSEVLCRLWNHISSQHHYYSADTVFSYFDIKVHLGIFLCFFSLWILLLNRSGRNKSEYFMTSSGLKPVIYIQLLLRMYTLPSDVNQRVPIYAHEAICWNKICTKSYLFRILCSLFCPRLTILVQRLPSMLL